MSTKLKAGTSTSGAVLDADTTGILELQTGSTPTTAITVDALQNVGIGTASPAAKLDIGAGAGSLNTTTRVNATSTAGYGGAFQLSRNGTSVFSLSDAGWAIGGSETGDAVFYSTSSYNQRFYTGGSERMRIDSSGNLLMGTTSQLSQGFINAAYDGQVKQGIVLKDTNATLNGSYMYFLNSTNSLAGQIQHNGTTTVAYGTSSDYRLKENIAPMTDALNKVSALKPVTYSWKIDGSKGQGFIAHELAEVCPDAVLGEKDAVNEDGSIKPQGIDTSFLVATLTAAIQELNAKVTALEAQLGAK